MAATVNVEAVEQVGNSKLAYGTITLDSSYPTGGEAIAITAPEKVERIAQITTNGSGYTTRWDVANQKLLVYYADYDAVADGALIQVPDTTNLSSVTLGFIAVGQ